MDGGNRLADRVFTVGLDGTGLGEEFGVARSANGETALLPDDARIVDPALIDRAIGTMPVVAEEKEDGCEYF